MLGVCLRHFHVLVGPFQKDRCNARDRSSRGHLGRKLGREITVGLEIFEPARVRRDADVMSGGPQGGIKFRRRGSEGQSPLRASPRSPAILALAIRRSVFYPVTRFPSVTQSTLSGPDESVAANIAGRRSHYFHQPSELPSALGRHLFDKFCARTQKSIFNLF